MHRLWRLTLVVAATVYVIQLGGAIGYHVRQPAGWAAPAVAITSTILTVWRPAWALPIFVAIWPLLMGAPRLLATALGLDASWPVSPQFAWLTGLLVGAAIVQSRNRRTMELGSSRADVLLTVFAALVVVNGVSVIVGVIFNLRSALPFSSRYVGRSLLNLLGLGPFDDWAPLAAWLQWVGALALCLVARTDAKDDSSRRRLIGALIAGGVIQAAIALVRLAMSAEPLNRQERAAFGTLPDIHAIGSFLLVSLAACAAGGPARFRRRSAWILVLGILLGGLLASGSRNSWLGAVLVLGIGLAGGFAIVDRWPRLIRAMQVIVLAFAVIGGSTAALLATRYGPGDAKWTEYDAALTYRLSAFWTAGRIAAEHPLAGCGLGRFYGLSAYERYWGGTAFGEVAPENAHNFFLQQFAEAGPIALLLWCVIAITVVARCWRAEAASRACAMAALALVLTNLLAHSLLIPEFLALFAILIGALDDAPRRRAATWVWIAPVVAAGLGVVQLARPSPSPGLHPRFVGIHDWETMPDGSPYRWTRRTTGLRPVEVAHRWLVWKVKSTHDYVAPETPLRVTIHFEPPVRPPVEFALTDRHAWYLLAVEMPPDTPRDINWRLEVDRVLVPNRVRWTDDARPLGLMIMFGGPFGRDDAPAGRPDWQLAPLPAR
jgi:O-antigen ligase